MKKKEKDILEQEVKGRLIEEIKQEIPSLLRFALKKIFPKIEVKIINFIAEFVDRILNKGKS